MKFQPILQKNITSILVLLLMTTLCHGSEIFPDFSIAHATGEYKNVKYLNSVDSFEYNYNRGARVFEIDFAYTSDGEVVALHGSYHKQMNVPENFTYADWKNTAKYPPPFGVQKIDIPILIGLMKKYPDTYIVLDKVYPDLSRDIINSLGAGGIAQERIIPQLYVFSDAEFYKEFPGIKYKIFTIYYMIETFYHLWRESSKRDKYIPFYRKYREWKLKRDLKNFLKRNPDIQVLTMPVPVFDEGYLNSLAKKLNILIYVHPVDTQEVLDKLLQKDVGGIYTGSLFNVKTEID